MTRHTYAIAGFSEETKGKLSYVSMIARDDEADKAQRLVLKIIRFNEKNTTRFSFHYLPWNADNAPSL